MSTRPFGGCQVVYDHLVVPTSLTVHLRDPLYLCDSSLASLAIQESCGNSIAKRLTHPRKGVSFLSRIIGSRKKEPLSEAEDEGSEPDARMSVDTSHPIGFIPRHPAPSKYLRVRTHYKKDKTFNRVFLAQELEGAGFKSSVTEKRLSASSAAARNGEDTGRAIWALVFSKDGKYLAAAGQDRKVRVWAVITSPEEREAATQEEDETPIDEQDPPRFKAPVFHAKPYQVFEGHTGSILDLSWSKVSIWSSGADKAKLICGAE